MELDNEKEAEQDLNNIESENNSESESEDNAAKELSTEENLQAEITRLEHELAVARADFYNYRQRALKEKQENRRNAQDDVIMNFLPVLDNLDRALASNSDDTKNILTGVEMVQRQFLSTLESLGVNVIPAIGEKFDPALHEAAGTEEIKDPEQDGIITSELLRGYKTEKRVLRAARVMVGKA